MNTYKCTSTCRLTCFHTCEKKHPLFRQPQQRVRYSREVTLAYFLLARQKISYLVHFTLGTTVFVRGREVIHNTDV